MTDRVEKTLEAWRAALDPDAFAVCRLAATERPFTGRWTDHSAPGSYHCVCCDAELFAARAKFHSGCGWPSFFEAVGPGALRERLDLSHGMRRIEVLCARCDAHLGHMFPDGPEPTGLRYCINSVALDFKPEGA